MVGTQSSWTMTKYTTVLTWPFSMLLLEEDWRAPEIHSTPGKLPRTGRDLAKHKVSASGNCNKMSWPGLSCRKGPQSVHGSHGVCSLANICLPKHQEPNSSHHANAYSHGAAKTAHSWRHLVAKRNHWAECETTFLPLLILSFPVILLFDIFLFEFSSAEVTKSRINHCPRTTQADNRKHPHLRIVVPFTW